MLTKLPAAWTAPVRGSIVETLESESPFAVKPPRTVKPAPFATTASREIGELMDHDSTPASTEGRGAVRRVSRWAIDECAESLA
jgi:hypothetical protein